MTNDGSPSAAGDDDENDQRADVQHFSPTVYRRADSAKPCGLFGDPKGLCRISPTLMNFKKFVQTSHYGGLAT
jgi:hypothetical protein